MATPVDKATAFREAQRFLSDKGIVLTGKRPSFAAPKRANAADNASDYYIFNADNGKGFAVISGDDRTPQVLGYGLEGTLDADNLPVNIKEWLQEYQRQSATSTPQTSPPYAPKPCAPSTGRKRASPFRLF